MNNEYGLTIMMDDTMELLLLAYLFTEVILLLKVYNAHVVRFRTYNSTHSHTSIDGCFCR